MLAYKNILVPVDFAEISKLAITKAASHSEASNSKLLVAHIVDDESLHDDSQLENNDVPGIHTLLKQAGENLDELLDSLEIGYCDKLVRTGEPVPTLLQIIAERGIDLVVMGTHKGTTSSAWVRSVTVEVVTRTECDVLVLHK